MADWVEEQLLGYLLEALEDHQREAVEEQLEQDPTLRRRLADLGEQVRQLDGSRCWFTPPADLAVRTCRMVVAHCPTEAEAAAAERRLSLPDPAPNVTLAVTAAAPAGTDGRLVAGGGFSWMDLAVAAGIVAAATLLIFPAIENSRYTSQLVGCQDNLRWVGQALSQYSQAHRDYFPPVAQQGPLSTAGVIAPVLLDGGYLGSQRRIVCPASPLADDRQFRVPSLRELLAAEDSDELDTLRSLMGGSYGYPLGFVERGHYYPARNMRRPFFALVADAPSDCLPSHQSTNHGGWGQNVLFEDFHVQFLTLPRLAGAEDEFFTNDTGAVAAGRHRNDSVIGSSRSRPID